MSNKTSTDISKAGGGPVLGLKSLSTKRLYPIDDSKAKLTLGSSKDADITVIDPYISRIHCFLQWEDTLLVIIDKSKNGMFVNDRKVLFTSLAAGDVLRMGRTHLVCYNETNILSEVTGDTIKAYARRLVAVHGCNRRAAMALGVSASTVGRWMREIDCRQ
tara:strand:+ start:94 stop:576 length:483 start_codon:yes stop_codon:yes gene_type:complete